MLGYIKCPKCKETSPLYTPYPKCYECGHTQYIEVNQVETENQNKVKEMVKHLIPTGTPPVDFPESSINPITSLDNGGWTCQSTAGNIVDYTISIPRNTLFMSRPVIAKTTGHETAHVLTFYEEESHGELWEEKTKNYKKN